MSGLEADKGVDDSDEEEFDELQTEVIEDFEKAKKANNDHKGVCLTIQRMANFIFSNNVEVS